jgi:hypothetical protein
VVVAAAAAAVVAVVAAAGGGGCFGCSRVPSAALSRFDEASS